VHYTWILRSLLCCVLLFASSCGSSTTTYVGTVDGTDVSVGLVTDGSHAALFFCGGPTSYATSTKWFRFGDSQDTFTAMKGTWTATGTTSVSAASGTLDRGDGQKLSWSAARVPDGSILGLYESIGAQGTAGIVVRSETDASGTQGAFIDAQLAIEQIIPILPLEATEHGLHVQIAGQDTFVPRATAE
jgi:hypothetical protein